MPQQNILKIISKHSLYAHLWGGYFYVFVERNINWEEKEKGYLSSLSTRCMKCVMISLLLPWLKSPNMVALFSDNLQISVTALTSCFSFSLSALIQHLNFRDHLQVAQVSVRLPKSYGNHTVRKPRMLLQAQT